jgi:hypothetical protein
MLANLCAARFGEEEAKQLAISAEQAFAGTFPGTCGLQVSAQATIIAERALCMPCMPSGMKG